MGRVGLLAFFMLIAASVSWAKQQQCVGVQGHLDCPTDRTKHGYTRVQLFDENTLRSDTLMDEGYTSESGYFNLYGCSADTFGKIDPEIHIMHKCGNAEGQGFEWTYKITPENLGKTVDLGRIDLTKRDAKFSEKKYKKNVGPPCEKDN